MRFAALANRFGRRFRHRIVAMDGVTTCRERLDPALDVGFVDAPVQRGHTLGSLRRYRSLLRDAPPDLLLTYNWGAIEWAMANRFPSRARHVHVEDGFGPEERARQLPRRVWTRRLALRGRTVVLPSQTLVRIATQQWRLDPRRIRFIPNGVDLDRFHAAPRPPGPCVVGTVAALRPEKNVGRLIRAFAGAGNPDARLVIVGDGPERQALEALAAQLNLSDRVTFTGALPDPAPRYRTFDVFALSSDTEQQPLSLLEAMASGCAVTATDVGDVKAMLPEASRPLVARLDEADLAARLALLTSDLPLRASVGSANRAHVERLYGEDRMLDAWDAVFSGADQPAALTAR